MIIYAVKLRQCQYRTFDRQLTEHSQRIDRAAYPPTRASAGMSSPRNRPMQVDGCCITGQHLSAYGSSAPESQRPRSAAERPWLFAGGWLTVMMALRPWHNPHSRLLQMADNIGDESFLPKMPQARNGRAILISRISDWHHRHSFINAASETADEDGNTNGPPASPSFTGWECREHERQTAQDTGSRAIPRKIGIGWDVETLAIPVTASA